MVFRMLSSIETTFISQHLPFPSFISASSLPGSAGTQLQFQREGAEVGAFRASLGYMYSKTLLLNTIPVSLLFLLLRKQNRHSLF